MERLGLIVRPFQEDCMTIVITRPDFFDGEAEQIASLLRREDIDLLHIRKPKATRQQTEQLLKQIPRECHSRLVLHDHHSLAADYSLYGIHLNSRNPQPLPGWNKSVSISCHSLQELSECQKKPFRYMSLSPIFDSISKKGYNAAFTAEELEEAHRKGIINERVMALGGVTFEKVKQVLEMGFGGAMILGDAWK